jgi:hypothetical protein
MTLYLRAHHVRENHNKTAGEITMPHEKYQHCIDACQECITACEHCSSECLREDKVKSLVRCIELDRTCAYMCAFAANEMSRGGEFSERVCRLCAEICDACAEECAKHDMEHCAECARACRKCAEACREMAMTGTGASSGSMRRART